MGQLQLYSSRSPPHCASNQCLSAAILDKLVPTFPLKTFLCLQVKRALLVSPSERILVIIQETSDFGFLLLVQLFMQSELESLAAGFYSPCTSQTGSLHTSVFLKPCPV